MSTAPNIKKLPWKKTRVRTFCIIGCSEVKCLVLRVKAKSLPSLNPNTVKYKDRMKRGQGEGLCFEF